MSEFKRNATTVAIYRGLFKLLETQNFDAISVNDICQNALISRTTFYTYFEDKYQLVLYCFEEERRDLGMIRGVDIERNMILFLKRVKDNRMIYHNLLTSSVNRDLNRMIASQFSNTVNTLIQDKHGPEETQILNTLYTGGIVFSVMNWVENGCVQDIETLTHVIAKEFLNI